MYYFLLDKNEKKKAAYILFIGLYSNSEVLQGKSLLVGLNRVALFKSAGETENPPILFDLLGSVRLGLLLFFTASLVILSGSL